MKEKIRYVFLVITICVLGYASFVFDDDGELLQGRFRKGIEGVASDYEFEIYYRPDSKGLCYMINNVIGYLSSDKKELGEVVEFFMTVDTEGMFVEVASTLGY